ncbi:unnamed protein product [Peronospora destructor]|uniref:TRP C-terminal domain-containing protein n=1 Tax=Peronospora destructor TaxID=86335 RepID=A0AAV0TX09_9STRA|nr:unnamed protein product [Peronospora destructor]
MRIYSAASVAVALGIATGQTSTLTSYSPTFPPSRVSTSSGSSNAITIETGSVSCVFRYTMPTATNLPNGVSTPSITSTTSPDSDLDDEKEVITKSPNSVGNGSEDGRFGELDSSSLSNGKDAIANVSKPPASTTATSTSATKAPLSTTKAPALSTSTPASTTETKTSTTEIPASTTKASAPTTKASAPTTKASAPTLETQTSNTTTPTSTKTESSISTLDDSMSTTTAKTSPSTGPGDHRRLIGEIEATSTAITAELLSNASDSTEPITSPSTTTLPSTTTTPPSTTTTPPSTTTTPPSTTTTPPSTTKIPSSPSSTTKTPSLTTIMTPSSTTKTSNATSANLTTMPEMHKQMELPNTSGSVDVAGLGEASGSKTIEFSCDETFYSAWNMMGLTCEGAELDTVSAVASTECLIYSGISSGTEVSDLATCMSICRFPACNDGTWDYSSDDGINSAIYANLDFVRLMSFAGSQAAQAAADGVQQPFSNLTFAVTTKCDYSSDTSFSDCQCAGVMTSTPSSGASGNLNSQYAVPFNKGLEDSHHWADGTKKTTVDKAGIASTTIAGGAATVSIVAGGVMSVVSGIVGGTSAGVASGVSAAASVGITLAAVDICQFSIMLTQMNVDARPRFMENMGKKMAPATFTFLPFGKSKSAASDDLNPAGSTATSRRLADGTSASGSSSHGSGASTASSGVQGMEKYAALIGVDPDMLFYLAVAGIAFMVGIIFGLYVMAMGVCYFIVKDFTTFSRKWLDKAIGVLMMILILSEYVVGATAMYQICFCIDHDSVGVSFFLAIAALLGLAFGTILYGVLVIKNNEDELRDLGTKDHFDKKFHNRYGPLYDEHSFEGRFFFAPKLLLALFCGMTTGMVWIQGLWQIVVLIALHIVFLLYLEIKQPYPTAFVQKTSSFVIIIKISALFLSFFLLSSATSFTESIPDDLREGVAFAIVGLQVLVLLCLMIRQVYIFYRTWKLKRDGASADKKTVTMQMTNARAGSEAFFALGGEAQCYSNNTNQNRGNSPAMLGNDTTPKMQDHYAQQTPSNINYNYGNRPHGSQPQQGDTYGMQHNRFVAQHNNHHRNNEAHM